MGLQDERLLSFVGFMIKPKGALAVLLVELFDGADGAAAHVAGNELRIAPVPPHPLQKRLLIRLGLVSENRFETFPSLL
jgi:hypothetical protein